MFKCTIMTLQDLCIEVIVDEFERHFLAFSNTDDVHLKRKFEFLQRVYSYDIASRLYVFDKMQANYVDLLVNKYIKVLDTGWFKDVPWETVVTKFAEVGPNIQKICFREGREESWINIIHHLVNVEVTNFAVAYVCNDEILERVAQFCHNIVEIRVSKCLVTNKGIKYLCMKENGKLLCPKLKKLFIWDTFVKWAGVKCLIKNLRSLEVIKNFYVPGVMYSLHENDLSALDKVEPYSLTSLDFSCFFIHDVILKVCLTLCPRLKSLFLVVLNQEHFILFSAPIELEQLHLLCASQSEIDITDYLKLKGRKLQTLSVCLCSISVPTLAESCPCLKELILIKVIFKNDDDVVFPVFHCLEKCHFEGTTNDFTAVKSISLILRFSAKLKYLAFARCDLSLRDLRSEILNCCVNSPVRELCFSDSTIDTQFVKDILQNCQSLTLLKLKHCGFFGEDRRELNSFAQMLPNHPKVQFA